MFRKLFNLTKDDDVCQYVIKRPLPVKDGKKQKFAAPKVQRLVSDCYSTQGGILLRKCCLVLKLNSVAGTFLPVIAKAMKMLSFLNFPAVMHS